MEKSLTLPELKENKYLILYRYDSQGRALQVVRRKEFTRLTLDEISEIHLPLSLKSNQDLSIDSNTQIGSFTRIFNEHPVQKKSLIGSMPHFPNSLKVNEACLTEKKKPAERKKRINEMHLFSPIDSPRPMRGMYSLTSMKNIINIASQETFPDAKRVKKSIEGIKKLINDKITQESSMKFDNLKRMPPRKRFKIWNSPKFTFRLI